VGLSFAPDISRIIHEKSHGKLREINLKERDHLKEQGVDGRIILRWIFRKWDVRAWTRSSWLRIGTGGGHF
jgi:hypothetical protein